MKSRIAHLRIKVKCLAAEATLIRQDERKYLESAKRRRNTDGTLQWSYDLEMAHSLREHRVRPVRFAARDNVLALACLKKTPYALCETKTKAKPDLKEIEKIALRFGPTYDVSVSHAEATEKVKEGKEQISTWISHAKKHLQSQGYTFED